MHRLVAFRPRKKYIAPSGTVRPAKEGCARDAGEYLFAVGNATKKIVITGVGEKGTP
jgi:hypothetical protein